MSSQDDINFINEVFNIVFSNDTENLHSYLSNNINGELMNNILNDSFNASNEFNNYNQEEVEEIEIEEEVEEENINNYINPFSLFNYVFYDPIEEVLQESLNMQPDGLEKTEHIIKISSSRYETLDKNIQNENKSCSICIADFDKEDKISITNCNHIFHTDCITEWGKYKIACPICREKLE